MISEEPRDASRFVEIDPNPLIFDFRLHQMSDNNIS